MANVDAAVRSSTPLSSWFCMWSCFGLGWCSHNVSAPPRVGVVWSLDSSSGRSRSFRLLELYAIGQNGPKSKSGRPSAPANFTTFLTAMLCHMPRLRHAVRLCGSLTLRPQDPSAISVYIIVLAAPSRCSFFPVLPSPSLVTPPPLPSAQPRAPLLCW